MILTSAEDRCTIEVLKILKKRKARYSEMFKKTKVSHTTLQNVLKFVLEKKFVFNSKEGYEISDSGRKFLKKLEELFELVR